MIAFTPGGAHLALLLMTVAYILAGFRRHCFYQFQLNSRAAAHQTVHLLTPGFGPRLPDAAASSDTYFKHGVLIPSVCGRAARKLLQHQFGRVHLRVKERWMDSLVSGPLTWRLAQNSSC